MHIHLLDSHFPWLARHGGFALLQSALRANGCSTTVTAPRASLAARAAGKLYSRWRGYPPRNQSSAFSECEFLLKLHFSKNAGHVLFLEEHLEFLAPLAPAGRWIATIHLPRRCWKPSALDLLRRFPAMTVLCEYMREQFSDLIDPARLSVLPYGVDASFFRPDAGVEKSDPPTLLFVGAWLRNTAMLARLVPKIERRFPGLHFDFVVPLHARDDQALSTLSKHPRVRWHHNLSDEELRDLYQKATALLLPMEDSGANTAVVEALACGLPIVTTDVGGIRSYGGGTVFPVVMNNDDAACVELVAAYLTDEKFRSSVSRESRRFAATKLDWPVAAKEYMATYRSLGYL